METVGMSGDERKEDHSEGDCPQLAIVSEAGLEVGNGIDPAFYAKSGVESFRYSPNGKRLAFQDADGVHICLSNFLASTSENEHSLVTLPAFKCFYEFSPRGTFMVTWERANENNMIVWNTLTGAKVRTFNQKHFVSESWPYIKWDEEEIVSGRLVSNGIEFFDGNNIECGVRTKLDMKDAATFSFGPRPKSGQAKGRLRIAVVSSETSVSPASCQIFMYPSLHRISMKSFYKSDWAQILWNPLGDSLLVLTQTERDTTGKSYYGETNLHYMSLNGKNDCRVPFEREGSVHSVEWSPSGTHFACIQGRMPPTGYLYSSDVEAVFTFGTRATNHVRWAPHGKFLVLVGLGGVNGDAHVWEVKKNNYCRQIGSTPIDHAHLLEWAPNGRQFMTAITWPRLRVDNGFSIWTPDCKLLCSEKRTQMSRIDWAPSEQIPSDENLEQYKTVAPQNKEPLEKQVDAPKKSVYVPPHMRAQGRTAGSNVLNKETENRARKIGTPKEEKPKAAAVVPGAQVQMSKSSARNIRRKEARKNRMMGDGAKDQARFDSPVDESNEPEGDMVVVDPVQEVEVTLRKLRKKARQVEGLKVKRNAGEQLSSDQLEKINHEASLLSEISTLERKKGSS